MDAPPAVCDLDRIRLCALRDRLARAQAPQAPTGPPIIRSLEVQYTGPATISKERILAQMRTKVGQPYSNEIVQEDIKALYKTGFIRNVRIFAQPEGDGVKVIVAVQTRAIIREIEITGAEHVSSKRLRKEVKVRLNQAVDEQKLEDARQKIVEVYQGKGFTDVNVQFRIDPIDEQRGTARVVFTVNEGAKGAVSQVRFEGNAHVSQRELRKQMKTKGRTLIYFVDKTGRLDEVQLEQDLDKIRELLSRPRVYRRGNKRGAQGTHCERPDDHHYRDRRRPTVPRTQADGLRLSE